MTTLHFKDDRDYILFILDITNTPEHCVDFILYEVSSWDGDTNEPIDKEQYVKGIVKWDGCSHLVFGEDNNKGYLHLCGVEYFKRHCKIIEWLYKECIKLMPDTLEGEDWKDDN